MSNRASLVTLGVLTLATSLAACRYVPALWGWLLVFPAEIYLLRRLFDQSRLGYLTS